MNTPAEIRAAIQRDLPEIEQEIREILGECKTDQERLDVLDAAREGLQAIGELIRRERDRIRGPVPMGDGSDPLARIR